MGVSADEARRELARREIARRKAAASAAPPRQAYSDEQLRWLGALAKQGVDIAELDRVGLDWQDPGAKLSLRDRSLAMVEAEKRGLSTASRNLGAGATRLVTGPGQLVTAGGEAIGVPGADVKRYNQATRELEATIAGQNPDPTIQKVGEFTGAAIVPAAAAGRAETLRRALFEASKTGAVTGAAFGASSEDETPAEVGKSAAKRAGVGAALGATVGTLAAVYPALKNSVRRLADLDNPVKSTAENIAQRNRSAFFRGMPTTLGEETGSPALLALQNKLIGKESVAFQNKQLESLAKGLDAFAKTIRGSVDPKAAALKLSSAFGKQSAQMQRAASKEYGDSLDAIRTRAAQAPDQFEVPFDNFRAALKEAVDSTGGGSSWWKWISPEILKAEPQLAEALQVLQSAGTSGRMNVETIINVKRAASTLRRGLNKGANMTPAEAERNRLGRAIANAVDADIDQFLSTGLVAPGQSTATREALEMLQAANARYRERLDQLGAHQASFVGQVFGGKVPADAAEAFEKLIRMPESEQIVAINALRNSTPEVLDDIKAWKIQSVSDQMRDHARAGNMSIINPQALIDELTNGSQIVANRFWSPAELQHIKSGIASARVLLQAMPSGRPIVGTEALDIGRTGAAAATRSPAFVTMHLYKLLGSGNVRRMLFTEEGIKALRTLERTYKAPTAETIKALTILTNLSEGEDPKEPE